MNQPIESRLTIAKIINSFNRRETEKVSMTFGAFFEELSVRLVMFFPRRQYRQFELDRSSSDHYNDWISMREIVLFSSTMKLS